MATSPSAVSNLPEGYSLEQPSTPQPQQGAVSGLPAGYTLEKDNPSTSPQTTEDKASNTRQMLVSGLTGMPTPNMTEADKASFAKGKAAGAISVPVVAGATLGATAAPEVLPPIIDKAKAVVKWAVSNPGKSYVIGKIADELGIHPFDLMHSVVKYGKNLFGDSEETK
jgi:hypothetical protein